MEALQGEVLVSNSIYMIYAEKDRNGPPSANQVVSRDEPRRGHAVCTLSVHPSTLPFLLKNHLSPRDRSHETESLMTLIGTMD